MKPPLVQSKPISLGQRTWEYWDTHVQKALAFHKKQLGI